MGSKICPKLWSYQSNCDDETHDLWLLRLNLQDNAMNRRTVQLSEFAKHPRSFGHFSTFSKLSLEISKFWTDFELEFIWDNFWYFYAIRIGRFLFLPPPPWVVLIPRWGGVMNCSAWTSQTACLIDGGILIQDLTWICKQFQDRGANT